MLSLNSTTAGKLDPLLTEILAHLEGYDIIKLRAVSRTWAHIIEDTSELIYKVWLYIHGLIEHPHHLDPSTTSSTRLNRLLLQEQAWATFSPRYTSSLSLKSRTRLVFSPSNSAHIALMVDSTHEQLGPHFIPPFLGVFHLPTSENPITQELKGFSTISSQDTIHKTSFPCPESDLLVTSTWDRANRAHTMAFKLLHDPELDHPLAQESVLTLKSLLPTQLHSYPRQLFTMGELLLFHVDQNRLTSWVLLWNWHTAKLLARLQIARSAPSLIPPPHISLISPTAFLCPYFERVFGDDLFELGVAVYDFSDPAHLDPEGVPTPRCLRMFALPAIHTRNQYRMNYTCTAGFEFSKAWPRSQNDQDFPFTHIHPMARSQLHERDGALCQIAVTAYKSPSKGILHREHVYIFITHVRTLLGCYSSEKVLWSEWGRKKCALLHGPLAILPRFDPPTLFSSRCAFLYKYEWSADKISDWGVSLLDFNQYRVRRGRSEQVWPREVIPSTASEDEPSDPGSDAGETDRSRGLLWRNAPRAAQPRSAESIFTKWPIRAELPYNRVDSGPIVRGASLSLSMDSENIVVQGDVAREISELESLSLAESRPDIINGGPTQDTDIDSEAELAGLPLEPLNRQALIFTM